MSSTKPSLSAREKISRLRQRFIESLPNRLEEGKTLLDSLLQNDQDTQTVNDIHRFFHSLKGTSRSFGFHALGEATVEGDAIATTLIHDRNALPKDWKASLSQTMETLANVINETVQNPGLAEPNNASPSFSIASPTEHSNLKEKLIYICDDDSLIIEQLSAQLECFGYICKVFDNTLNLKAQINQKAPSAIIMDISFPEGDGAGITALDELFQERQVPIPTIFLSSRQDFEARLRCVEIGGSAYFQKPVQTLDLISALDHLTEENNTDPIRVLVIDDEVEIAHYHSVILQDAGLLTKELSDPSQVINVLSDFRPDLVLMDMYMPCCNGRNLAKMIRQIPQYVSLPIVYLSSETDAAKQFSAMRVGAEGFLTKPVDPSKLVAEVVVRAERMKILSSLMIKDSLTGLYNHSASSAMLLNAVHTAKREKTSISFVMLDIDHFKSINDTYGHPEGDKVLLAISRLLQQRLRSTDIIGRYGGEEFSVTLPNTEVETAIKIIDNLRKDFANVKFYTDHGKFSCTFSAGIASFPHSQTAEKLTSVADNLLYQAKHAGRNQVIGQNLEPTA